MEHFNFSKALELLKSGSTICLNIDGKTREYNILKDGAIACSIGAHAYIVKQFYIDAILSEDWYLKV